ncbi:MAG: CAAD domain-containing protein [Cyanobacteriota bacterium]
MESMQQSQEPLAAEAQKLKEAQDLKVDVNVDKPGVIVKQTAPSPSTDQPWQEWVQVASDFLSRLPDYVTDFFSSYQKPLLTVALIITGGITVKVTLAVLDAINDIPLLAPVFELVGIGYTAWFVYRYLLKVETRQELGDEFKALKGQVVGKEES